MAEIALSGCSVVKWWFVYVVSDCVLSHMTV